MQIHANTFKAHTGVTIMLNETTYVDNFNLKTFYNSSSTYDSTRSFRIINTPSEFAKENLFYIQEAGYLKSIKSHISQREKLNSYLFLVVMSGSGRFRYKETNYELHNGNCLFINCNHHYSHQSSEQDPWELMWIHFNGKQITPFLEYYEMNNPEVIFHTDCITDFTNIIETCLELEKKNDITTEFIISKMITDILTLCISRNKGTLGQTSLEKMILIKDYIDTNFREKISLGSIAHEFYISKHYLAREFKKFYGMTIGDYITGKRVTYSKELLRFTKKSIEEISAICGVPDTNYFAKIFRRIEECSPSGYRKKW
jgi:AraC-like DNA-binding protein